MASMVTLMPMATPMGQMALHDGTGTVGLYNLQSASLAWYIVYRNCYIDVKVKKKSSLLGA